MSSYMLRDHRARCASCGGILGAHYQPLTQRQAQLYQYLAQYIAANGYAPAFDEIARHFGYASLATVHEHLVNLERKGWIKRHYNESRSIECLVEAP